MINVLVSLLVFAFLANGLPTPPRIEEPSPQYLVASKMLDDLEYANGMSGAPQPGSNAKTPCEEADYRFSKKFDPLLNRIDNFCTVNKALDDKMYGFAPYPNSKINLFKTKTPKWNANGKPLDLSTRNAAILDIVKQLPLIDARNNHERIRPTSSSTAKQPLPESDEKVNESINSKVPNKSNVDFLKSEAEFFAEGSGESSSNSLTETPKVPYIVQRHDVKQTANPTSIEEFTFVEAEDEIDSLKGKIMYKVSKPVSSEKRKSFGFRFPLKLKPKSEKLPSAAQRYRLEAKIEEDEDMEEEFEIFRLDDE